MKKLFLVVVLLITTLCIAGCSTVDDGSIRNKFIKDVDNLKSYYLEGNLEITNNDDTYKYDVKVSYKKDNNYKVSLTNKANNYEQIILRNNDAVYVITPSLNKSFKFQSDWPNNNSQSYLLHSLAKDLKDDENYSFTSKNKDYIFTTKTNYPNNPKYKKQDIILDNKHNLKGVEVKDKNDVTYVKFYVTKLDKKSNFEDNAFDLEELTKNFKTNNEETKDTESEEEQNEQSEENSNETSSEETAKVDESIFPLYLPTNTTLSDKEVIKTAIGERVIMTFSGESPFILVQETIAPSKDLEIVPTYGEPFMLIDTVGSLTDTSYTWTSNGIEYYIVSDQMDKNELLEVAKSINVVSAINEK